MGPILRGAKLSTNCKGDSSSRRNDVKKNVPESSDGVALETVSQKSAWVEGLAYTARLLGKDDGQNLIVGLNDEAEGFPILKCVVGDGKCNDDGALD